MSISYRPDIDGLRGIAVLAVLLFHFDLTLFSGGFVGVDVFFVISGYLITAIIARDIASNRFTFANFYEKRIRRILPAYLTMVLVCTVCALIILTPEALRDFAASLAASAVFSANFYFAGEMNYFQHAAEEFPLLHTWSLAVEEQFYLLWPFALLALASRRLARFKLWLLALFCVFGAVFTEWAVRNKSETMVFFYTPFRAWEFGLGAMVALLPPLVLSQWKHQALQLLAFALLILPIGFYSNAFPAFPGLSAVPPCLGAAALIYLGASNRSLVSRLLQNRALVAVGLISYSLYLWHWPLLAFAKAYNPGPLPLALKVALFFASFGLAILSWRFIEQPFRVRPAGSGLFARIAALRGPQLSGGALAALVATFGIGLSIVVLDGLPQRASVQAQQASAALTSRYPLTDLCLREMSAEALAGSDRPECVVGEGNAAATAVLWGDSHANSYAPAIAALQGAAGGRLELLAMRSCSPLYRLGDLEGVIGRGERACNAFNERALQRILADDGLKTVYISSFWTAVHNQYRAAGRAEPVAQLLSERVLTPLTAAGIKVVLLGQPPVFREGGGVCLAKRAFQQGELDDCAISTEAHAAAAGAVNQQLAALPSQNAAVEFFDPTAAFCDEDLCRAYVDGVFAYLDGHHLNHQGALVLADDLAQWATRHPLGMLR